MNIITIAEHSVDMAILPANAAILDLGCRGFLFANHLKQLGHTVVAVDIENLSNIDDDNFYQVAITNYNGKCGVLTSSDPQATKIKEGNEIDCYTLEEFSRLIDIPFWDLIKIDIEGSEYEVIMSLTKAPATQLSIEFHLHTGVYGMDAVQEMLDKLEDLGYEIAKHELTEAHGCGYNYWDSLFILKS